MTFAEVRAVVAESPGPVPPAGYSGTALPSKLGIKPGHRVALIGAPAGFADRLEPLPERVSVQAGLDRRRAA